MGMMGIGYIVGDGCWGAGILDMLDDPGDTISKCRIYSAYR